MQVGVAFPQTEIGSDPIVIRDFAQAVEEMGYDHLTAIDHVLGERTPSGPAHAKFYTRDRMFHEPLMLFAFLAAHTSSLEFTTAILIMAQRQTALIAKQVAELDVLSGGRVRLGVGIGWNECEFEALGMNFRDRVRRSEEQVEVLRKLWSEDLVTFHGEWHTLNDVGINPVPIQRPIPVWFGAFQAPAIRRLAKIGDGWLLNPRLPATDEGRAEIEMMWGFAEEFGRDPADIGLEATVLAESGGSQEWAAEAAIWQDYGCSHVTFRTLDCGLESIDDHLEAMRRFSEAIPR